MSSEKNLKYYLREDSLLPQKNQSADDATGTERKMWTTRRGS
jgi:hypothetical protein